MVPLLLPFIFSSIPKLRIASAVRRQP